MTRTVWRCKTATRFSPTRTCTCADMHGWLMSTRTCTQTHKKINTVKQRHTQPNLKWVKLSQTLVNKRCLWHFWATEIPGSSFLHSQDTHKNMHTHTHTRTFTQPAPTSSNSYTHSFQKAFLHYFFFFSHAHTEPQITSVHPALPSLLHNSFGQLRLFLSVVSSHESSHQTEMPPFILLLSVSLCHTLFLLVCVGS